MSETPITKQAIEAQRLRDSRDEWAHARIDALQKEVAGLLGAVMKGDGFNPDAAGILLEDFKAVDKLVEVELGLVE